MRGVNIVFCSPRHGIGTTSVTAAVASAVAAIAGEDCVVMRTYSGGCDLEQALAGKKRAEATEGDTGIGTMITDIRAGGSDPDGSVQNVGEHLCLLAGSRVAGGMEPRLLSGMMRKITELLKNRFAYTFTDAGTGEDAVSREAVSNADIVVTVVRQNIGMMDEVMSVDRTRGQELFYLINEYDRGSRYSLFNLKAMFGKLKGGNSFALSHCSSFMDSFSKGRVPQFISDALSTDGESGESEFIRELKKLAEVIIRSASGMGEMNGTEVTTAGPEPAEPWKVQGNSQCKETEGEQ